MRSCKENRIELKRIDRSQRKRFNAKRANIKRFKAWKEIRRAWCAFISLTRRSKETDDFNRRMRSKQRHQLRACVTTRANNGDAQRSRARERRWSE